MKTHLLTNQNARTIQIILENRLSLKTCLISYPDLPRESEISGYEIKTYPLAISIFPAVAWL